jgi:hypothetical protein
MTSGLIRSFDRPHKATFLEPVGIIIILFMNFIKGVTGQQFDNLLQRVAP